MPFDLLTIPCLVDNYAFLLRDNATKQVALIDVPEAAPISSALKEHGWTLSQVWLTHHHWDHVDGLDALLRDHPARVIGAKADSHRLPPLDVAIEEGDTFELGTLQAQVLDVSGHTIGHVAYHVPGAKAVFTADSLMALGCGRLFEGAPELMWRSMQKLMQLPPETTVCSGHEYTASNAKFAVTIDPENPALLSRSQDISQRRAQNVPTVPSQLSLELATNPFLRCADENIRKTLGMPKASDAEVFAEIRKRKDNF
ncbi:MAG: hydroxyacylglutathione hydrolase [Pseudomonadota bacterium]